jgi:inner membrane transporter RhtA
MASNDDRTERGAPALVLLGIVSVQVGSALAKQLFDEVGSFGTVALRLFFAAAVLTLLRASPTRAST